MDQSHFPYPEDEEETISPDVAMKDEKPLPSGLAVAREEAIYGESSLDENRDDQRQAHHGSEDETV